MTKTRKYWQCPRQTIHLSSVVQWIIHGLQPVVRLQAKSTTHLYKDKKIFKIPEIIVTLKGIFIPCWYLTCLHILRLTFNDAYIPYFIGAEYPYLCLLLNSQACFFMPSTPQFPFHNFVPHFVRQIYRHFSHQFRPKWQASQCSLIYQIFIAYNIYNINKY